MAPRRPIDKPPIAKSRKHADGVVKAKKSYRKVRRLENGLLDVERTGGRYRKLIQENAASALLRLPGEIRNRIWEYALGGNTVRIMPCRGRRSNNCLSSVRFRCFRPFRGGLGLLRACRQIYNEAKLIPYQVNTFHLNGQMSICWLKFGIRPVQLRAIREIHIITAHPFHFVKFRSGSRWNIGSVQELFTPELTMGLKHATIEVHEGVSHRDSVSVAYEAFLQDEEDKVRTLVGSEKVHFKRNHCQLCAS